VRGEEWWNCCLLGEGVGFDAAFIKLLWPFVCVIIVVFRLDIQRDENEALKVALQSTLKAKEDDIKTYMDMMADTKAVFIRGIQQVRMNSAPVGVEDC